ncbi:MAG: L-serine ammonia-lyase [Pirellula sp.]
MVSIFELFKIGVGPSSSHTVGPMVAAFRFAKQILEVAEIANQVVHVQVKLYGSLALTGHGHATDSAILAGLSGCLPDRTQPDELITVVEALRTTGELHLGGVRKIAFQESRDVLWLRNASLPQHPNAMEFAALDADGAILCTERFFSTGGGFVYNEAELLQLKSSSEVTQPSGVPGSEAPYPFTKATELLAMARSAGLSIDEIVDANEHVHRSSDAIAEQLDRLWQVMSDCIDRGCISSGILPGSLRIARRAPSIYRKLAGDTAFEPSKWLAQDGDPQWVDPLQQLDWVSLFALAVNEENAAGGRVVTAPTNGAAGIIPAVLAYYRYFVPGADRQGIHRFLKTAGAIGLLYKRNASLSAAEMGCQGEVGVACSMAAAGLAACMGGTIEQIENAAEIGMEHNLGLTCDPIAGLVQVPCIERNTMGATKAINAARLAVLYGDGTHFVSLDRVIETMRQTGVDMQAKYKETSLGGLAVNVVDC